MYVGDTSCNVSKTLNDNILPVVDEVKTLGVIVVSHLLMPISTKLSLELSRGLT